jgi:hypothetical protein
VTSLTARDGERASCLVCHNCISISWLINLLDIHREALARAERKIDRLYTRGADQAAALRDERAAYLVLAELSLAVVEDQDKTIAELRGEAL